MCCFSHAPAFEKVEGTQIFARPLPGGRQALAYSMTLSARAPLAMILPLPVPPGSAEDAVEFVDLSGCPRLFHHLNAAFPLPRPRGRSLSLGAPAPQAMLKVHQVGDFEASFVPRVADFTRLDPRFRIEPDIWQQIPVYADYGFAVFQLRGFEPATGWRALLGARPTTTRTVHPMAFVFPSRRPDAVFFPTVHIHDGEVHATAEHDHMLYAQGVRRPAGWAESAGSVAGTVPLHQTADLVADAVAFRQKLRGTHPNTDIWVPAA